MYLLLIAAMARKMQFDNLPKFVDWAFDNFKVPFDIDVCKKTMQDQLKGKSWRMVSDQMSMIKFVNSFRSQPNVRTYDLKRANAIFVAIKEKVVGKN